MEGQQRDSVVEDLTHYITEYEQWLNGCMQTLGFTKEKLLEDSTTANCPIDPNHSMPVDRLKSHVKYCEGKRKGYDRDQVDAIEEGTAFFYEKSNTVVSVKIDEESFHEILKGCRGSSCRDMAARGEKREMPLTGERAQYDLRRDEKLAMYDYVRTVAQRENPSSSFSERELLLLQDSKGQSGGAKSKTYLERLAEERDFKRRRQSYRAKNVHITKKSYKEEIRDVIGNQMEILGQMWQEESMQSANAGPAVSESPSQVVMESHTSEKDNYDDRETHSKKRKRSRSRSREKRSKHSKKRSRSRERSTSRARKEKHKHKHKKHKHKKRDSPEVADAQS